MKEFDYAAASTVDEAVSLLAAQGDRARVLAGGTDIIVQLREGLRSADLVVDVKKIPELVRYAFDPKRGLRLGAATPCYQIYGDEALKKAYPALTDSANLIGGWQIQGRASIGGNLCNSSPAADSIPSLIALAGVAEIAGPQGVRDVPVEKFCTSPGRNVLGRGEFLVAIKFPAPVAHSGSAYLRFIPRNEMDIAVVGAGVWVRLNDAGNKIEEARIGLAAVAPTPMLAEEAGKWLAGKPTDEKTFAEAGEIAKKVAKPISDRRGPADYRTHLVGVLVKRALAKAVERAVASG